MIKQHQLEIEKVSELEGDSRPMTYYSKGHHDFKKFIEYLEGQGENTPDYNGRYPGIVSWDEKYMRHSYARCVPWCGEKYMHQYLWAEKGSKGAFPVTEYDYETQVDDWYKARLTKVS